jgi:hypothetical protein
MSMKYQLALVTVRRTLAANVKALTPEQARGILAAHTARGPGIGDPAYRALTGGYSSQSIDGQVTRALAVRAGLVGRRKR